MLQAAADAAWFTSPSLAVLIPSLPAIIASPANQPTIPEVG